MTLSEVIHVLDGEFLCCHDKASMEISNVCASDLMSDVLAFGTAGSLLITGLTNAQSVNTAEVADIAAVAYARGKRPADDVVRLAEERGLPVLVCALSLYGACGKLYEHGLAAGSEIREPQ